MMLHKVRTALAAIIEAATAVSAVDGASGARPYRVRTHVRLAMIGRFLRS